MTIAVTGATGNIGSGIISRLIERGLTVRAIARSGARPQALVRPGVVAAAGDLGDTAFLTEAFSGADAIFAMIPPNYAAPDFRAYQNRIGVSLAEAIQRSGVKYVVNLSSQGAHLPDGTGPIKGLYDQEHRLNALRDVAVLHLRPTYFMENLLTYIPMIKTMNIAGSSIRGDLKFAMIATADIASYAAERLMRRDFSGTSVRDLLGQRDLSLQEAVAVIGRGIDKPDLKYVQFSYEDALKGLIAAGLSEDMSRLFIEMSKALNDELFAVNIPRTAENTTPTSIEEFAGVFAGVYSSQQ